MTGILRQKHPKPLIFSPIVSELNTSRSGQASQIRQNLRRNPLLMNWKPIVFATHCSGGSNSYGKPESAIDAPILA